jgi:hypothetical protein
VTTNHEPRPRELSDAQLSAVLAAADDELMDYIQLAAEPEAALLTIMAGTSSHPVVYKKASEAAAVIKMRSMARGLAMRLDRDTEQITALVHAIDRADGRVRMLMTALDGGHLLDARIVHSYAKPLYSQLVHDAECLARDLSDANLIATDLMDRAAAYVDDIHPGAVEFCEVITRARNGITALGALLTQSCGIAARIDHETDPDTGHHVPIVEITEHARQMIQAYGSLRIRASAALDDLHLAGVLNPVRELVWIQVDVSGVDLSGALIDVEALVNVVWTSDTTWPEGMAKEVRARSEEVQPGVYKVRGGGFDKADLAKV